MHVCVCDKARGAGEVSLRLKKKGVAVPFATEAPIVTVSLGLEWCGV